VPENCTVVGVPGRVTVCSGERLSPIDLHHENLPDPVLDMFNAIERRLDRLEQATTELKKSGGGPDEQATETDATGGEE